MRARSPPKCVYQFRHTPAKFFFPFILDKPCPARSFRTVQGGGEIGLQAMAKPSQVIVLIYRGRNFFRRLAPSPPHRVAVVAKKMCCSRSLRNGKPRISLSGERATRQQNTFPVVKQLLFAGRFRRGGRTTA